MIKALEPLASNLKEQPSKPLQNPAISRCFEAWTTVREQALANGKTDYKARCEAIAAYREALPPLSGAQNISDFIACVGYAITLDIIIQIQAESLLNVAKIALAAIPKEPKKSSAAA
jgi:hypothetical protein